MSRIISLTSLIVVAVAANADAAKLKTWQVSGSSQYADARFENLVINDQGVIRLAQPLEALAALDANHVWDMIEDKEGNMIVAVGHEGKVLRVTPAGKVSVIYEHKGGLVLSLALTADGTIYAGTGPEGKLVRIPPKDEPPQVIETGESYIWALLPAKNGPEIYAATGPKGRILKITPEGEGKVGTFYQTKQDHILCLTTGNGSLFAGTDKQGLIYQIDAQGKGTVLHQTPQGEVRSLLFAGGTLYAGTAAPTKRRGTNGTASSITLASLKESSKDGERTVKVAAPTTPVTGENSVFRIAADGSVREIFRQSTLMLCLAMNQGKLLVGGGMDGKLFEVDEATRDYAEIARPDVGQIMRMVRKADGKLVLGTGDPAKLFVLREGVAAKGSVISEVHDAKIGSKWGAFTWRAEVPSGSSVTLAVRGGNTSEPDATWSDWSAEFHDPTAATFQGAAHRFVQFRATMNSKDGKASPALQSVTLRYASANQAPEITSIDSPDLDAVPLKDPKKIKLKWMASDPNEDELTFDLFIRKDGWNDWTRIEEAFGKNEYEWDTTTVPSGIYRFKVIANDRADNPDESTLTGLRESAPILVAHEQPQTSLKLISVEDGKATLEASASSPHARLISAAYAVNGKRWENLFPTDGLFDGKQKTFRFQVLVQVGTNVVVIRVKDVAANTGTADVVFPVK